jgi:hypothetical protein
MASTTVWPISRVGLQHFEYAKNLQEGSVLGESGQNCQF